MTFNINPVNIGSQGIGSASGFGAKPKAKEEETKEAQAEVKAGEQKSVPADRMLELMAQTSVKIAPKTALDPAKYVDEASAARIAGFMAGFEDKVAEGLAAFEKEFAGVKVSDSAKMAVVLAQVENEA